jgi:site-specific recombinase XerD
MDPNRRWEVYLGGLSETSREIYQKRLLEYRDYCFHDGEVKDMTSAFTIDDYIVHLRENAHYKASTVWTIYSMLSSFYEAYHNHKVLDDLAIIQKRIKQWAKTEKKKKAKTFEKEEIFEFLTNAPNDDFYLPRKVVAIIGLTGLERLNELTFTE